MSTDYGQAGPPANVLRDMDGGGGDIEEEVIDQDLEVDDVDDQVDGDEPDADEAIDVTDLARELAGAFPEGAGSGADWQNDAKGKLIAQGWDEGTAHRMAFHSKKEKVQELLAGEGSGVQSEGANPANGPSGDPEAGAALSSALEGILDDSTAAKTLGDVIARAQSSDMQSLRQELAFMREQMAIGQSTGMADSLVTARGELREMYPEVNNRAQWDELKPQIRLAMPLAKNDPGRALKLALASVYGDRNGPPASNQDSPSPRPNKPGKLTPGSRALTEKDIKAKVAKMIWDGESEAKVLKYQRDALGRLK